MINLRTTGFLFVLLYAPLTVLGQAAPPKLVCEQPGSGISPQLTSATCTGSVTAGSGLIVFLSGALSRSTDISISDTDGDALAPIGTDVDSTGAPVNCGFSQCFVAFIAHAAKKTNANEVFKVTWTTPAIYIGLEVAQWTGQAADMWDGSGFAACDNCSGPMTVTSNGSGGNTSDLSIALCANNDAAPTPGVGYTTLNSISTNPILIYKTRASGNDAPSCDYSGPDNSVIEVLTLRSSGNYGLRRRQAIGQSVINLSAVKIPITVTAGGSLLVITGQNAANGYALSLTDSQSNTYTTLVNHVSCGTEHGSTCIAGYLANVPAGVSWVQMNISPTDNGLAEVIEYDGAAKISPLDTSGSTSAGVSSPWSSPSVTPSNAKEIAVGIAWSSVLATSAATLTPTGSWNRVIDNVWSNQVDELSDQFLNSRSPLAYTGTSTGTGTVPQIFLFKVASP